MGNGGAVISNGDNEDDGEDSERGIISEVNSDNRKFCNTVSKLDISWEWSDEVEIKMEVNFAADYLSIGTTKDGDIVEVTGEGAEGELTFSGKTKKVYNIPVNHKGKTITFTPTNTQGKRLIEAWGNDTKAWIGKKFEVIHVDNKMMVRPFLVQKV